MSGSNQELKCHLEKCKQISTERQGKGRGHYINFLSNCFRETVLKIVQKRIVDAIVTEIKQNGNIFGIMVDTSQDISSCEQCSIVVRYVNRNSFVRERTVSFVKAMDCSGKGLFNLIKKSVNSVGLSLSNAVGISTDGAGNMAGCNEGVQRHLIKTENMKCLFTWCFSHRLNLVVQRACLLSKTNAITAIVERTAVFMKHSYKRTDKWVETVKDLPQLNPTIRLKLIGQTRWSSKQDAVHNIIGSEFHFIVLLVTLFKVLNIQDLEGKALEEAHELLKYWLEYENVLNIFIIHQVFQELQPTMKFLQSSGLSMLTAMDSIKKLNRSLENMKLNFETILKMAEMLIDRVDAQLAENDYIRSLGVTVSINKRNAYDGKDLFMALIDNLQRELQIKFISTFEAEENIYKEVTLLDLKTLHDSITSENFNINSLSLDKICTLADIEPDAEIIVELCDFAKEYVNYQEELETESDSMSALNDHLSNFTDDCDVPVLAIESFDDLEGYDQLLDMPQINLSTVCYCINCILKYLHEQYGVENRLYQLYKYIATLPMTQVKCERDFSSLKYTKNKLRSRLTETNLESIIIISSEADMLDRIKLNDIVDDIAQSSKHMAEFLL